MRQYSSIISQIACFIPRKLTSFIFETSISCALETSRCIRIYVHVSLTYWYHPSMFCCDLKLYNSCISSLRLIMFFYIKGWTVKISKTRCTTCIIIDIIWFLNTLQTLQNSDFSSSFLEPGLSDPYLSVRCSISKYLRDCLLVSSNFLHEVMAP